MNIQIFGTNKCFDTKKAMRYFKERNIKYQFIDLKEKGMSKGEYNSVKQAVGGLDKLLNPKAKDKDVLALIKYISEEDNATERIEYLKELYTASKIPFELVSENVNDSQWADGWKKFFKCTEIGKKLVIRPSWEEYDNVSNRKVLSIDPGAAFGQSAGSGAGLYLCPASAL